MDKKENEFLWIKEEFLWITKVDGFFIFRRNVRATVDYKSKHNYWRILLTEVNWKVIGNTKWGYENWGFLNFTRAEKNSSTKKGYWKIEDNFQFQWKTQLSSEREAKVLKLSWRKKINWNNRKLIGKIQKETENVLNRRQIGRSKSKEFKTETEVWRRKNPEFVESQGSLEFSCGWKITNFCDRKNHGLKKWFMTIWTKKEVQTEEKKLWKSIRSRTKHLLTWKILQMISDLKVISSWPEISRGIY